jgi:hypothetical protein
LKTYFKIELTTNTSGPNDTPQYTVSFWSPEHGFQFVVKDLSAVLRLVEAYVDLLKKHLAFDEMYKALIKVTR